MPTANERHVRLAAKLYQARDAARRLLGDRYASTMADLGATLQRTSEETKRQPLSIAIEMSRSLPPMAQLYVLAAVVELTEPSAPAPSEATT